MSIMSETTTTERLWDHLWTASGASYTFNVCTNVASEYYHRTYKNFDITAVTELYDYYMYLADKRVADWALMSSPFPTLIITTCYLIVVLKGPSWMENRKPWSLLPVIRYLMA